MKTTLVPEFIVFMPLLNHEKRIIIPTAKIHLIRGMLRDSVFI